MSLKQSWLQRVQQYRQERRRQNEERRRTTREALQDMTQQRLSSEDVARVERVQDRLERARAQAEFLDATQAERQTNAQAQRAGLDAWRAGHIEDTRSFLDFVAHEREDRSNHLRRQLRTFRRGLRHERAEFLRAVCRWRHSEGRRERLKLLHFHRSLSWRMQAFLEQTAQDRVTVARLQDEQLHAFHENLALEVQSLRADARDFLELVSEQHRDRAAAVAAAAALNRASRARQMAHLHARMAALRNRLKQFHQELKAQTWTEATAAPVPKRESKPAARVALPAKPALATTSQSPTLPAKPSVPSYTRRTTATASEVSPKPFKVQIPAPRAPVPGKRVLTPPAATARVAATATVANRPANLPAGEARVYDYLARTQGAVMREIETDLGINRFQATDALRGLMDRGLIVKSGRSYLVSTNGTPGNTSIAD